MAHRVICGKEKIFPEVEERKREMVAVDCAAVEYLAQAFACDTCVAKDSKGAAEALQRAQMNEVEFFIAAVAD